jgi:phospholipase/carboxylesterase/glyoxalase family protein
MTVITAQLGFIHRFVPSPDLQQRITLLALHGTGGNENEMVPLAQALSADATVLSPRGKVLEGNRSRFFRRFAQGDFDIEDLKYRTRELAEFTERAASAYGFDLDHIVAVGYSNGANIAASLLLLCPRLLAGAILFRPMVPVEPAITPDLTDIPVFIASGRYDSIIPAGQPERLARMLKDSAADVTLRWEDADHRLQNAEIGAAREWLASIGES